MRQQREGDMREGATTVPKAVPIIFVGGIVITSGRRGFVFVFLSPPDIQRSGIRN